MPSDTTLSILLQATAMLLLPTTMGASMALCLMVAPSGFSIVAIDSYLTRTRAVYGLWILIAAGWIALAIAEEGGSADWLTLCCGGAVLASMAALIWERTVLAKAVAIAAAQVRSVGEGGDVLSINEKGAFIGLQRSPGESPAVRSTGVFWGFAVLTAVVLTLFIAAAVRLGAHQSAERLVQCLLIAAVYFSAGIISVDLSQDVWPGFVSQVALRRSFLWYVLVFEQWRNWIIVAALMAVVAVAPAAYGLNYVSSGFLAFPIWFLACVVVANIHNQILRPMGKVTRRLPLPVMKNEYSAKDPVWALFLTVVHVVMLLGLVAAIVSFNTATIAV